MQHGVLLNPSHLQSNGFHCNTHTQTLQNVQFVHSYIPLILLGTLGGDLFSLQFFCPCVSMCEKLQPHIIMKLIGI